MKNLSLLGGGALLVGTTAGGIALAPSAGALTFTVTNTSDCSTAGCGSLRQAIIDANNHAGADTITFDPSVTGTITLTSNLDTIDGDLTITGPGSGVVTVDGTHHFWGITQTYTAILPGSLTLSGLTFSGTRSDAPEAPHLGAISWFQGDVTLRDTVVTDSGGDSSDTFAPVLIGLPQSYDVEKIPRLTLDHVSITGNHGVEGTSYAPAAYGGSILAIATAIDVDHSTFDDNSADQFAGPALIAREITVSDSSSTRNHSRLGYSGFMVASQNTTISGSRIEHNSGRLVGGLTDLSTTIGGFTNPTLTITDTSISHNTSTTGAVSVITSTTRLDRVTIVDNASSNGFPNLTSTSSAGVAPARTTEVNYEAAALAVTGTATIESSTIADNAGTGVVIWWNITRQPDSVSGRSLAPSNGSRILPRSNGPANNVSPVAGTVHLSHSTVSGNSMAGITSMLYAPYIQDTSIPDSSIQTPAPPGTRIPTTPANVVLDHALLADNGGASGLDVEIPFTARFSLIERPSTTGIDGPGGGNVFGVDPGLLPLEWYSAIGAVRPIPIGSAAWNTGDPDFTPPPATDQTGSPRVVEIVDIGAYEIQAVIPRFTG